MSNGDRNEIDNEELDDMSDAAPSEGSDDNLADIIKELRESIDDIDTSLTQAAESGAEELPRMARDATRRHRQAWKRFMELRRSTWG